MKQIFLLIFVVITFNACTVTSHYRVTPDLQFEKIPEKDRITYVYFGRDKFVKVLENENTKAKVDFADEFSDNLDEGQDPLEGYNRAMTSFNDYLYMNILNPVAKGYSEVVPEKIRVGVSNFLDNITFPIRFINNILQFKFDYAAEETGRFLVNSTVGVLGFIDVSSDLNLKKRDEDFGQTLAYYGFSSGPHIVLPVYGPSNLRDIVGIVADGYVNPLDYTAEENLKYKIPENFGQTFAIKTYGTINSTSLSLGQYENLRKDAIDLYPFLRDVYEQNRQKQIEE